MQTKLALNIKIPIILILIFCCNFSINANGQKSAIWSLNDCITFAQSHNLTIQQAELNKRLNQLTKEQSQWAQLPNINGSIALGRYFGRSIDPTTNSFVNNNYGAFNLGLNADVLLFGWFQKRNTLEKNDWILKSSNADYDQIKNDISLNIATGYLRALLAKEQVNVSNNQLQLSKSQLDQTQKFAKAGKVPELSVLQIESQYATDSSNLITAQADYFASLLDLKALLNLDMNTNLEVIAPNQINEILPSFTQNTPEQIFQIAANKQGVIKSAGFKLNAAKKNIDIAKAGILPYLNMNGHLGTSYASINKKIQYQLDTSKINYTGSWVDNSGVQSPVYQYGYDVTQTKVAFGTQLSNNLNSYFGIGVNVPIFNGLQAQNAIKQSKLNYQSQEIAKTQVEQKLKQDVFKAYNEAQSSIQKYKAAQQAYKTAMSAYDFAQKRFDLGLTNSIEYLSTKNTYYKAEINQLLAKYDLIFRIKIIDYYLGNPIQL